MKLSALTWVYDWIPKVELPVVEVVVEVDNSRDPRTLPAGTALVANERVPSRISQSCQSPYHINYVAQFASYTYSARLQYRDILLQLAHTDVSL